MSILWRFTKKRFSAHEQIRGKTDARQTASEAVKRDADRHIVIVDCVAHSPRIINPVLETWLLSNRLPGEGGGGEQRRELAMTALIPPPHQLTVVQPPL